jgi:hypothetical protein
MVVVVVAVNLQLVTLERLVCHLPVLVIVMVASFPSFPFPFLDNPLDTHNTSVASFQASFQASSQASSQASFPASFPALSAYLQEPSHCSS